MKVILVHGWGGNIEESWLSWLKNELAARKVEVHLLSLPNPDWPMESTWLPEIEKLKPFDSETVMVGHSLGCIAILKVLERMSGTQKIGKAILVAGWTGTHLGVVNIKDFFKQPVDFGQVKKHCKQFFVINSDNDHYIKLELGKELAQNLGTQCIVEHNSGHITISTGFGPYPRVLQLVLN